MVTHERSPNHRLTLLRKAAKWLLTLYASEPLPLNRRLLPSAFWQLLTAATDRNMCRVRQSAKSHEYPEFLGCESLKVTKSMEWGLGKILRTKRGRG